MAKQPKGRGGPPPHFVPAPPAPRTPPQQQRAQPAAPPEARGRKTEQKEPPYVAQAAFDPQHPTALTVYCSDGRFTDAIEELLHQLGHPRLDTMTLPGGAALFELTTADFSGLEAARSAATFLVKGHAIRSVVLLAHEGCGYYKTRNPHDEPRRVMEKQVADLRSAAKWFRSLGVEVRLYYARVEEGRVVFHPVVG